MNQTISYLLTLYIGICTARGADACVPARAQNDRRRIYYLYYGISLHRQQ